jgi:hypothetical protein
MKVKRMEEAIYYPGFEIGDENWLKFALLYVDKLFPIIPPEADHHLSDAYRRLRNETDLICPHRPDYTEGQAATLDAISEIETISRHPQNYAGIFSSPDITQNWRSKENWQYTLFEQKFTPAWMDYCVREGFGKRIPEGLVLDRSLGLLYMSILAQAVSESRELPSLTDNAEMDKISIVTRGAKPVTPKSIRVGKGLIELRLPANLSGIPLEKIIKHRATGGFKTKLHAFHKELGQYIKAVEDGIADGDFFETRGNLLKDFSDELVKVAAESVPWIISVHVALSTLAGAPETVTVLADMGVLAVNSVIGFRENWEHTRSKHFTRKYLVDLENLR